MPLNHTSFYPTIYFMSLDRTSFYWIICHSIGLYTSCHLIGLRFIGSYVIHSFIRASCNCHTSFCQKTKFVLLKTKFMSLDRRPFDRTLYVMPPDRTSCHCIGSETSFHRASGLLKKVCFPECFCRYVTANMAAHLQGQHRTAQELIKKQHKNGTS